MIIIGAHAAVYPARFVRVGSEEELASLRAMSAQVDSGVETHERAQSEIIAWFGYDLALAECAKSWHMPFAMRAGSVSEFLMSAYFLPRFVIVDSGAKAYQELADSYVLDSKVLQVIASWEEIELYARQGIDGVIFAHVLEKER